jgi:hypothetical protein
MARINIRYKMLSKMLPRKWGDEGHGLGEPAPGAGQNGCQRPQHAPIPARGLEQSRYMR